VFEKGSSEPPDEGRGGGDRDEGFGGFDALLEVSYEATVLDQPSERAFDDPAPRQGLEADDGAGPSDDRERHVGFRSCPGFQPTGVAAVREHGLDEGERRT
jgi:hypothetical protein